MNGRADLLETAQPDDETPLARKARLNFWLTQALLADLPIEDPAVWLADAAGLLREAEIQFRLLRPEDQEQFRRSARGQRPAGW